MFHIFGRAKTYTAWTVDPPRPPTTTTSSIWTPSTWVNSSCPPPRRSCCSSGPAPHVPTTTIPGDCVHLISLLYLPLSHIHLCSNIVLTINLSVAIFFPFLWYLSLFLLSITLILSLNILGSYYQYPIFSLFLLVTFYYISYSLLIVVSCFLLI